MSTQSLENVISKEEKEKIIKMYQDNISCYKEAYQISFVGTKSFIKTLSTYFKGGTILPDLRKENSWYFNLGGNLQVLQAYHLMYDNATRFLQRKYLKFQSLLKKYSES